MALANYGVVHGYQLWYMKNDWRQVLVYCGRNIVEGRCAGKKGNKHRVLPNKVRTSLFRGDKGNQASKKPVKKLVKKHVKKPVNKNRTSHNLGGTSQSPKWTKKQILNSKKVNCPFRFTLDVVKSDNGSVSSQKITSCFKDYRKVVIWVEGNRVGWVFFKAYMQGRTTNSHGNGCKQSNVSHCLGCGITIISDSHKGLIDDVNDWLPEAEHKKCTRHIYIKLLDANAYDYLIQRNPNSWSRAFFEMDRRCATFENRISESFNRAILGPRIKPIITMLEEIRLYIMQRLVAMNKLAFSLEDTITPSIRKRLDILKEKQREWIVFPNRFQELVVRKGDQSYGVSLQHKVCQCRMWELRVPYVHVVVAYMHVRSDLDAGVSYWYRKESWFNAY
ncbi:hypothetical protein Tco_1271540 [Tanacetum coccineum]